MIIKIGSANFYTRAKYSNLKNEIIEDVMTKIGVEIRCTVAREVQLKVINKVFRGLSHLSGKEIYSYFNKF